ncbi:hypothetical protein AVT97_gp55 [Sulfolobales Virus YNP2]|uniref:hypothetical protein n=1 Tax=Sulfolobales Virus YNP2 TaxID=1732180 RepID=UPI000705DC85|nr:hypothetical protein AVT97_gp55 [Sulfolobales Virus YNP2]ALG97218.1 hypothetical protein [Sulfolobales Virus YNP2]
MEKGSQSKFLFNAMSPEEYTKAKEFYEFLKSITKCTHGYLRIDRKKLVDMTAAFMEVSPYEAHQILTKMMQYGWIHTIDNHYIIVNID